VLLEGASLPTSDNQRCTAKKLFAKFIAFFTDVQLLSTILHSISTMYSEQRSREPQQVNNCYPPRPPRQPAIQQFHQQQLRQLIDSQPSVSKFYGASRSPASPIVENRFQPVDHSTSNSSSRIPPSIQLYRQSSTSSVWTSLTENSQDDGDSYYCMASPRRALSSSPFRPSSPYRLEKSLSERSSQWSSDLVSSRSGGEKYEAFQKLGSHRSLDDNSKELPIEEKLHSLATDVPRPNMRGLGKLKPPPPASYSTTSRSSSDGSRRSVHSRPPTPPVRHSLVEIAPGVSVRLRGADETLEAVRTDYLVSEFCICCQELLHCTRDADMVLCPVCKVVTPLESNRSRSTHRIPLHPADDYHHSGDEEYHQSDLRSVGLGMKHDTVCLYRQEIGV
jgi:hypothetical protein